MDHGTIKTFSLSDAVGRIQLDDGSEIRFGASVLRGIEPAIGTRVIVLRTAPHPLGGLKATEISLAEQDASTHRENLAAFYATLRAQNRELEIARARDHELLRTSVKPIPFTEVEAKDLAAHYARHGAAHRAQEEAAERAEVTNREAFLRRNEGPSLDHWAQCLTKAGIQATAASRALEFARPAARLVGLPAEGPLPPGTSKFGGPPDLPADFIWPRFNDHPLAFLAQIRLSEMPSATRADLLLPSDGLLVFFYAFDEAPWGFEPSDQSGSLVALFTDVAGLVPTELPPETSRDERFRELRIHFIVESHVPHPRSAVFDGLGFAEPDRSIYASALDAYEEQSTLSMHWLGGYAIPVQGPMEIECALVTRGISMADPSSLPQRELTRATQEAAKWRLLLQLEEDYLMGTTDMGGGSSRLYFFIHERALREQRFGRSCCILQKS